VIRSLAAALLALAVAAGGGGADASGSGLGPWVKILGGGKTRCARGGKYAFWVRKGDPQRLLIFFQGGGGCFDERTCALGSTWFDDRVDAGDDPELNGGILDLTDTRNPFRSWSVVYIPSCTGDVTWGRAPPVTDGSRCSSTAG